MDTKLILKTAKEYKKVCNKSVNLIAKQLKDEVPGLHEEDYLDFACDLLEVKQIKDINSVVEILKRRLADQTNS